MRAYVQQAVRGPLHARHQLQTWRLLNLLTFFCLFGDLVAARIPHPAGTAVPSAVGVSRSATSKNPPTQARLALLHSVAA